MGKWSWNHLDRVGAHSQGRLHFLWSEQDDGQNQPTTMNQRGHPLENPHMGIRGHGHGQKKILMQSLKQYHTHFYWLYEKGMTWAMVGLQWLHISNAFRCPYISASMGLKSFCPWCPKGRGTLKMITVHLKEVHYRIKLCGTHASHSLDWMHRASWTTIQDVKPCATRNIQSKRDRKR